MPRLAPSLLFFIIVPGIFQNLSSQTHFVISGRLSDSLNNPIPFATILIKHGTKPVGYGMAKADGTYSIDFIASKGDSLSIFFHHVATDPLMKKVRAEGETIVLDAVLSRRKNRLKEVVYKIPPIKRRGDTIVYQTASFEDRTEYSLEDLLKKLPGIEVNPDGKLLFNGKAIKKILLEGEDLIGDRYKLLSKNLRPEVIKEVEVLKHYDDNPLKKQFQRSNDVALNLNFKKKYKNILFGNTDMGIGTSDHYDIRLNSGLIKRGVKLLSLSQYNTIGSTTDPAFKSTYSVNAILARSEKKEPKPYHYARLRLQTENYFDDAESRRNRSFLSALSLSKKIDKNLVLRGLFYYNHEKVRSDSRDSIAYLLSKGNASFFQSEGGEALNRLAYGEFELKYYDQKKTFMRFISELKPYDNPTERLSVLNQKPNEEYLKNTGFDFYNHFNLTHRISPKTLTEIYLYGGRSQLRQKYRVNPNRFTEFSVQEDPQATLYQHTKSIITFFGAHWKLRKKSRKWRCVFGLNYDFKNDGLRNQIDLKNKSDLERKVNKIQLVQSINYQLSKKADLSVEGSFSRAVANFINEKNYWSTLLTVKPSIGLKTFIGKFSGYVDYDERLPDNRYFHSDFFIEDYRRLVKGTSDYRKQISRAAGIRYDYTAPEARYFLNGLIQHSVLSSPYIQNAQVSEDFEIYQYDIGESHKSTLANLSLTKYAAPLSTSLKLAYDFYDTQNKLKVNAGNLQRVVNRTHRFKISGTTYLNLPINFKFSGAWALNRNEFQGRKVNFNDKKIKLKLSCRATDNQRLELRFNQYWISDSYFRFLSGAYNLIPKGSRFRFQISFQNLFDVRDFSLRNTRVFEIRTSCVKIIPRYFMGKLSYRF